MFLFAVLGCSVYSRTGRPQAARGFSSLTYISCSLPTDTQKSMPGNKPLMRFAPHPRLLQLKSFFLSFFNGTRLVVSEHVVFVMLGFTLLSLSPRPQTPRRQRSAQRRARPRPPCSP